MMYHDVLAKKHENKAPEPTHNRRAYGAWWGVCYTYRTVTYNLKIIFIQWNMTHYITSMSTLNIICNMCPHSTPWHTELSVQLITCSHTASTSALLVNFPN